MVEFHLNQPVAEWLSLFCGPFPLQLPGRGDFHKQRPCNASRGRSVLRSTPVGTPVKAAKTKQTGSTFAEPAWEIHSEEMVTPQ
jgi:hypothetical protein